MANPMGTIQYLELMLNISGASAPHEIALAKYAALTKAAGHVCKNITHCCTPEHFVQTTNGFQK